MLGGLAGLARVRMRNGRRRDALQLCARALAGREASLGEGHDDTLESRSELATLHRLLVEPDAAEPLCRRALAGFVAARGESHPRAMREAHSLVLVLQACAFVLVPQACAQALVQICLGQFQVAAGKSLDSHGIHWIRWRWYDPTDSLDSPAKVWQALVWRLCWK